jgi:hypothetical protein
MQKCHQAAWGSRIAPEGPDTQQLKAYANAIAARVVRSIRKECLDHMVIINERHLHALLAESVDNYNGDRPQRSLQLQSPIPRGPTRDRTVLRVSRSPRRLPPSRLSSDPFCPLPHELARSLEAAHVTNLRDDDDGGQRASYGDEMPPAAMLRADQGTDRSFNST